MLKTTLPIQSKKLDSENNLKIIKEDITVDIDTSIFAEQRWETNFPANATRETLFAYIERIDKEKLIDTAHILVIENYASEVDVDDLVNQINIKLAEAM